MMGVERPDRGPDRGCYRVGGVSGAGPGVGTSMELYKLGLPRRQKTHWDYLLDEMVILIIYFPLTSDCD